jgi:hypothetical protein
VITTLFDFITSTFVLAFGLAYRWLDQNVISHILVFIRGFEQALVMLTVIAFLLLMVYMMIKHVKRLPKSYKIEIVDICGKKMASICYICRSKKLFTVLCQFVQKPLPLSCSRSQ